MERLLSVRLGIIITLLLTMCTVNLFADLDPGPTIWGGEKIINQTSVVLDASTTNYAGETEYVYIKPGGTGYLYNLSFPVTKVDKKNYTYFTPDCTIQCMLGMGVAKSISHLKVHTGPNLLGGQQVIKFYQSAYNIHAINPYVAYEDYAVMICQLTVVNGSLPPPPPGTL